MISEPIAVDAAGHALMPVYDELPFSPVRGEGVWLWDAQGRRVLDLWGGHAVAVLGHSHPHLLAALREQAGALMFQSNVLPLPIRELAACHLLAFAPRGLERVFFVNSGAEANENALRLALRRTGRRRVVAVEGGFHGRSAATGALSAGSAKWYAFPQAPFDVTIVPRGDLDALAGALLGGDVAALILEPIQGVAGAYELGLDYLLAARELTRDAGALLIFDEVQTGMGRTGWPFAAQMVGVEPDLLTVAKGLAGGFPAGAVLATGDVAAVAGKGTLGSTFGGGPLACALILAVLDVIDEAELLPRVRAVSTYARERCVVGPVTSIQGAGLLLGLRTTRPAREIVGELLARDVLAGTSADPHVLRILPPLILTPEHVDRLAAALAGLPR